MTAAQFFLLDLHLPPKADTCAEFQLSTLIFIFISCPQLLTAVDSWWQLSQFFLWHLHIPPKADTCANFQLSWLLGGLARECDRRTHRRTDRHMYARQVKIELTQPCLDGDRAWVGQLVPSPTSNKCTYRMYITVKSFPPPLNYLTSTFKCNNPRCLKGKYMYFLYLYCTFYWTIL